jgi:hypothetical protein
MNSKLILKFQAMDDDLSSLLEVFQKLFSLQTISSSLFQTDLKSSFPRPEDSIVTSLYHQFSTFGKYCDAVIGYRWMALSSIMDLVIELQTSFFTTETSQFQQQQRLQQRHELVDPFVIQLLQNGIEDLNHCALMIPFLKS